ncbi:unnamed protein product, partial [Discosporangium mesarthrocarpum]
MVVHHGYYAFPTPPPSVVHGVPMGQVPAVAGILPEGGVQPQSAHLVALLAQQNREEERKRAKRAANRKAASTSRARKRELVERMSKENEEMRRRMQVLSLLPEMILSVRRDGVVTFASENCQHFLQYSAKEVDGTNIFDLVVQNSHGSLREVLEESLGDTSKEAIATALRDHDSNLQFLKPSSRGEGVDRQAGKPTNPYHYGSWGCQGPGGHLGMDNDSTLMSSSSSNASSNSCSGSSGSSSGRSSTGGSTPSGGSSDSEGG